MSSLSEGKGHDMSSTIAALEKLIQEDAGNRGIAHLHIPGELEKAAVDLYSSTSVCIVTGFACLLNSPVLTESDGPPGAVAIGRMLVALGKSVEFVIDEENAAVMKASIAADPYCNGCPLVIFPSRNNAQGYEERVSTFVKDYFISKNDASTPRIDHIVAIERAGPGPDGKVYTMRARDVTATCGDLHLLFQHAATVAGVHSTGIGDGGNEIGMGKVFASVQKHITNGAVIANVVATDHLITAGVSNWGGCALAAALWAVHRARGAKDSNEDSAKIDGALPSAENERVVLQALNDAGGADGILNRKELWVDGMPFEKHADIINQMRQIVGVATSSSSQQ